MNVFLCMGNLTLYRKIDSSLEDVFFWSYGDGFDWTGVVLIAVVQKEISCTFFHSFVIQELVLE